MVIPRPCADPWSDLSLAPVTIRTCDLCLRRATVLCRESWNDLFNHRKNRVLRVPATNQAVTYCSGSLAVRWPGDRSLTIILIHGRNAWPERGIGPSGERGRSEEHTSELQ